MPTEQAPSDEIRKYESSLSEPMDEAAYSVRIFRDSVKFYLPRVEGYLEVVREMASQFGGMSLIEFDGYFKGRFEPVKYMRIEIHTNDIDESQMTETANRLRVSLKQESLAFEFNNKLILVEEKRPH
jgi:hypothetical protein